MFCECPVGSPVAPVGEPGEILQALKAPYSSQIFSMILKKHKTRCLRSEACTFLHEPTNTLIAIHADEVVFATPRESVEFIYQLFEREMMLRRGSVISKDVWTPYLGRLYRRTEKGFEVKIPERFWQGVFDLLGLKAGTSGKKMVVVTPFATQLGHQTGTQTLSQELLRLYRTLTRKIMWAGGERPELLYAAKELCRHFGDATQSDLAAAKHLAYYLLGTLEKTLKLEVDDAFASSGPLQQLGVQAVSAATWTSITDGRSTSGGTLWVEGFLLYAWSKTQPTISQSSSDAKLLAADLCAREGFFVASILEEVGLRPEVHLLTDRAGTLESTMCQPGVRELWIQEAVREHRLEVFYVPGQINVADALTKALPRERFEQLMSVLGVRGFSSTVR